jgi:hypothetical protein
MSIMTSDMFGIKRLRPVGAYVYIMNYKHRATPCAIDKSPLGLLDL